MRSFKDYRETGEYRRKLVYPTDRKRWSVSSRNMKTQHLRLLNFPETQLTAMLVALENWAIAVGDYMRPSPKIPSEEFLEQLAEYAWSRSGLRCHALETLDRHLLKSEWPKAIACLRRCAACADDPHKLSKLIQELEAISKHLLTLIYWIDTECPSLPLRHHCAKWRTWKGPGVYLDPNSVEQSLKPVARQKSGIEIYAAGSQSQQSAIRNLVDLIRVKQHDWCFGGVKPRTNAIVVGLSGGGKSWVCGAVASISEISLFTTSVGAWCLKGGSSSAATIDMLREHLANYGPSIVLVDEIDKLRLSAPDNINYTRLVFNEIMAVLDGGSSVSQRWSVVEIDALRKSHFILAGAFQDIYRAQQSDANLSIEGGESPAISFDEIMTSGWLPEELTNRVGALVEIRPPAFEEVL